MLFQKHEILNGASLIGVGIAYQADFVAAAYYVNDAVFRVIFLAVLAFFENVRNGCLKFYFIKGAEICGGNSLRTVRNLFLGRSFIIRNTFFCNTFLIFLFRYILISFSGVKLFIFYLYNLYINNFYIINLI